MDLSLNESESMLRDTARRLAEHLSCCGIADFETFDRVSAWKSLSELGFVGLRLPGNAGGVGSSTVDVALMVEALANRLIPVPFLGTALAIELLLAADAPAETLGRIASGEARVTIGLSPDLSAVSASQTGDVVAFDGADAQAVIALSRGAAAKLRALNSGTSEQGVDLTRILTHADAGNRRT